MAGITHMLAGMPSLRVTEIGEMRLQTISFFLLVFLLSTWAVQGLWNWLRWDFDRLPRLTYRRSLALVTLWGLLFVLVLTMISGARELMTPGAWEPKPNGLTYQLKDRPKPNDDKLLERKIRLMYLQNALWDYAARHDGNLPRTRDEVGVSIQLWEIPELSRAPYVYLPGRRAGEGQSLVVYEPAVFSTPPLGLFSNGIVREIDAADIGGGR